MMEIIILLLFLLFFTDIPLLPSITSLSLSENEEKSGPFVVHWLNNKELHFTLSMEVFLQQLRKSLEQSSSEASVEDSNQADIKSDEGKALRRTQIQSFVQNSKDFYIRVTLVTVRYKLQNCNSIIQIWVAYLIILCRYSCSR